MKQNIIYCFLFLITFSSCFKDYDERVLLKDNWVEFDLATTINKASGKNYSIVPGVDKLTAKGAYRINMTGEQKSVDQIISFKVIAEETTAVEGYHYTFDNENTITIPANSSFGYLNINVLPDPTGTALLVVELEGNESIKPMENYKRIAIPLDYLTIEPIASTVTDHGTFIQFDSITIGAHANNLLGCFVNLQNGAIHSRTKSTQDSHLIDLNYQWSNSNNANFMSLAGEEIISFGAPVNGIVGAWSTRNESNFIRFTNISSTDNEIYDEINSGTEIEDAYNQALIDIDSRSGHQDANTFGAGRRIRNLAAGDIVFYKSIDRGFYAIIRIKSIATTSSGSLTFEYKTQKL